MQQVCDISSLLHLEQQALHRNIYRNSFRACNSASLNFTVNPLFEHGKSKTVQTEEANHKTEIVGTVSVVGEMSVRDGVHRNPLFDCQLLETEKEDHISKDSALRDGDQSVGTIVIGGVSVRDGVHINPLFDCQILETEKEDYISADSTLRDGDQSVGTTKFGQESGYSSLSDSVSVPQAHFLRLLPPSKPQMVERSFESLASWRRSASLRDYKRRPGERSEMGGSLKMRRKHRA